MDILSDVGIKGNLSLSGDMHVDSTFGINYNGTKLRLNGCSDQKKFSFFVEDSYGSDTFMDIYKSSVSFNQTIDFNNHAFFRGLTKFCNMVSFEKSITLMCTATNKSITLNVFCNDKLGKFLSVNAPISGDLLDGSVYRRFSYGGDLVRTNNRSLLTVPENCTKFFIFEGMKDTEFLPVINSYEVASEGCLKKVDMDIFITGGSIIGERVSTEEKYYLFGFYLA